MNSCIVIGGGIIGMLTARSLLKRNWKVTLLEKGPFGQEASWAGGGILSPLYPWRYPQEVNRLVSVSQSGYPTLVKELEEETGIDSEHINSGLLVLGADDLDEAEKWAKENQIDYRIQDEEECLAMEPSLTRQSHQSLLLPNIAQIRNPRLLKAIQAWLQLSDATMLTESEVTTIETNENQAKAVVTKDGRRLEADSFVIANGAWSGRLLRQMKMALPIQPVRGQMLLLHAGSALLNKIIISDNRYLIPRNDGQIIVGSTVEQAEFDKSTTDQAFAELRHFASATVARLANARVIRHWAGLRPGCGDGIPYIGPHPEIDRLFINAGHFRNGIAMAPASAELLAGLINGEQPDESAIVYSLEHPYL